MKYIYIQIIILTLFSACKSQNDSIHKDPNEIENLYRVEMKNVSLSYKFQTDTIIKGAIMAKCLISNYGSDTLFYLYNTCVGITYDFEIDTTCYYFTNEYSCNSSWDQIAKLSPNESFEFNLHIMRSMNNECNPTPEKITLNLIAVNRFVPDEKFLELIRKGKTSARYFIKKQEH